MGHNPEPAPRRARPAKRVDAGDRERARVGAERCCENANEGGFARAIGTRERDPLTGLNSQVDITKGEKPGKAAADSDGVDGWRRYVDSNFDGHFASRVPAVKLPLSAYFPSTTTSTPSPKMSGSTPR